MRLIETAKFRKQRAMLLGETEKEILKKAILEVIGNPLTEKKLLGELAGFHYFQYSVTGRPQKLIYKFAAGMLVLFSFGPRHVIFKP
jgi:hypothetical protein